MKSKTFAEIYDTAGLVKTLPVESAQGRTLINFFQVVLVLILASWMPSILADPRQRSCKRMRKSLASGASKWSKRLERGPSSTA